MLDVLFPSLTAGLVGELNRTMFAFKDIEPLSDKLVKESQLQRAMLFEIATARAEILLQSADEPCWDDVLRIAVEKQRQHFNAKIPDMLYQHDKDLASHAADNLVFMLRSIQEKNPEFELLPSPSIPGLGWISSSSGDFSLGNILIEVKHTDRNFTSRDFRQVLMYWLLKYSSSIEHDEDVWADCILLNPRRNLGLLFKFDNVLHSASASSDRVELLELLRSIVGNNLEHR